MGVVAGRQKEGWWQVAVGQAVGYKKGKGENTVGGRKVWHTGEKAGVVAGSKGTPANPT